MVSRSQKVTYETIKMQWNMTGAVLPVLVVT
jgi:hypothetical protein